MFCHVLAGFDVDILLKGAVSVCTLECEKLPKVSCPIPRSENYSRCRAEFSATDTGSETTIQCHHLQPCSCHRTNFSCSNSCILRLHGTSTLTIRFKTHLDNVNTQAGHLTLYVQALIYKQEQINLSFSCMPHCAKKCTDHSKTNHLTMLHNCVRRQVELWTTSWSDHMSGLSYKRLNTIRI